MKGTEHAERGGAGLAADRLLFSLASSSVTLADPTKNEPHLWFMSV